MSKSIIISKKFIIGILFIAACFVNVFCEAKVNRYYDGSNKRVIYTVTRRIDYGFGPGTTKIIFNKWIEKDGKSLYCVSVDHHGMSMQRAIPSNVVSLTIDNIDCQLVIFNSPYHPPKFSKGLCRASYLINEEQMNLLYNAKQMAVFTFTFDNTAKHFKSRKVTYKDKVLHEIQQMKYFTYEDFDSNRKLSL